MKKKEKNKVHKETIYIMVQTVVLSLINTWFVCWCFTEGNNTFITFLTKLQESSIGIKEIFDMGLLFFPIFLVTNGFISLGTFLIVSSIIDKKKK